MTKGGERNAPHPRLRSDRVRPRPARAVAAVAEQDVARLVERTFGPVRVHRDHSAAIVEPLLVVTGVILIDTLLAEQPGHSAGRQADASALDHAALLVVVVRIIVEALAAPDAAVAAFAAADDGDAVLGKAGRAELGQCTLCFLGAVEHSRNDAVTH